VDNFDDIVKRGREQPAVLANVENSEGRELGVAAVNLKKGVLITARLLSQNVAAPVDQDFLEARIRRALVHREAFFGGSNYYRLINGEGDQLPGVFCDRYGDVLILQFTSTAMEHLFEATLTKALKAVLKPKAIVKRCDMHADRTLDLGEFYEPSIVEGTLKEPISFQDGPENDFKLELDALRVPWYPGRFFEERPLRKVLRTMLPTGQGQSVLALFSESLGSLCAARGATVTFGLGSKEFEIVSKAHLEKLSIANNCSDRVDFLEVKEEPEPRLFSQHRPEGFDFVLLEPPPLAPTYGKVDEGMRKYTAWVGAATSALKPGGYLLFTCRSRTMQSVRILRCVNMAIWSLGRQAQVVHRSVAPPSDFPVHMALPDSNHMRTIVLRVN